MSEVEEVVLLKMRVDSNEKSLVIEALRRYLFDVRVTVALVEKGIKYEMKPEDLERPQSLEMNPWYEQVPILIHNGKPIINSLIIVEYIDETWSGHGPNLLPSNPYERSQGRIWADYVDKKIYATASKLWKNKDQTEEETEDVGKELLELFKKLEEELGDKDYFGGQTFGFLDIALIPLSYLFFIFKFLASSMFKHFSMG